MLAHRGGIPSLPKNTDPKLLFSPDSALDLLYKAKPIAPSGHRAAYHALTAGYILGEIIRRVTGKDSREFLAEKIKSDGEWAIIVDQLNESLHEDSLIQK